MSTFKEYLEKSAVQAKKEADTKLKTGKMKPKVAKPTKENQSVKNTKIAGGDEVVNENEDPNGIQFKIELERLILKAIDSGVEDSKIGDIIKDSLEYYVDNQELSDEALFWK